MAIRIAIAAVLMLSAWGASAAALPPSCVAFASAHYGVPPDLLYAVHGKEQGRPGRASVENANGTRDLGWMQINEINLTELAKYRITRAHLLHHDCLNVAVSAWKLRGLYDKTKNWRESAAAYNGGYRGRHRSKPQQYATEVMALWAKRIEDSLPSIQLASVQNPPGRANPRARPESVRYIDGP